MTAGFSLLAFTNDWVIYLDAALYLLTYVVCCTSQLETSCEDLNRVVVENWEGGILLTAAYRQDGSKSEKPCKWLSITCGIFWYEKKCHLPVRCDSMSHVRTLESL
jgi:hypothetical protein